MPCRVTVGGRRVSKPVSKSLSRLARLSTLYWPDLCMARDCRSLSSLSRSQISHVNPIASRSGDGKKYSVSISRRRGLALGLAWSILMWRGPASRASQPAEGGSRFAPELAYSASTHGPITPRHAHFSNLWSLCCRVLLDAHNKAQHIDDLPSSGQTIPKILGLSSYCGP